MRVNDELHITLGESFAQLMELIDSENNAKMGYRYVVLIDMVAVFLWRVGLTNKTHGKLMVVKTISDVPVTPAQLDASDGLKVKLVRVLQ
jgi:hypothetical protein